MTKRLAKLAPRLHEPGEGDERLRQRLIGQAVEPVHRPTHAGFNAGYRRCDCFEVDLWRWTGWRGIPPWRIELNVVPLICQGTVRTGWNRRRPGCCRGVLMYGLYSSRSLVLTLDLGR